MYSVVDFFRGRRRSHLDECVSPKETLHPVQEYTCFGTFRNGSAGFLKDIQKSLKFECLFVSNLFQDDPKMIFNNVEAPGSGEANPRLIIFHFGFFYPDILLLHCQCA